MRRITTMWANKHTFYTAESHYISKHAIILYVGWPYKTAVRHMVGKNVYIPYAGLTYWRSNCIYSIRRIRLKEAGKNAGKNACPRRRIDYKPYGYAMPMSSLCYVNRVSS